MRNIRYVIVNRSARDPELRVLAFSAQGRYTYPTRNHAAVAMETHREGLRRVIGDRTASLEVLAVECWPQHHDPKCTVFGDDYTEPGEARDE
jgi:hypothetical protein